LSIKSELQIRKHKLSDYKSERTSEQAKLYDENGKEITLDEIERLLPKNYKK